MGGMAVGGDNAHARTREENLRTKQFFSHPAGDFLPTYPRQAHRIRPAFGAHASDAVGACPPSEHLYISHPSTYHTTRTNTYTRAMRIHSYDAIRHTCTGHGHFQSNVVSQPYITVSKSVTHSDTIYALNIILSYM